MPPLAAEGYPGLRWVPNILNIGCISFLAKLVGSHWRHSTACHTRIPLPYVDNNQETPKIQLYVVPKLGTGLFRDTSKHFAGGWIHLEHSNHGNGGPLLQAKIAPQ